MPVDVFGLLKNKKVVESVGTLNQANREKWLKKTLKQIPKGKKILDAGAGELQYKKYCKHLRYTSQDFAQYDGSGDSKGLQTGEWDNSKLDIISDITSIPVKDKSFDAVMCVEVLEHMLEPALAVREFGRILKVGGKLIITAPFASITHFAPHFYSSGYSEYWYRRLLVEEGFKIINLTKNGNYFEYLAQETRRLFFISSKYAGINLEADKKSKKLIENMVTLLEKINKGNKNSEDLLCYGIQIEAIKL